MGLFQKLFGRNKDVTGPGPTRSLNLQFAVTPENGEKFSNQFKEAVKSNENMELKYTSADLDFIDKFLQRFRDEGLTVNDFAETIFVAGCYVGQIMVLNNGGHWIERKDANLPEERMMTQLLIKLPDGTICDPVGKSFKRFFYGEQDSIRYFYAIMTSDK